MDPIIVVLSFFSLGLVLFAAKAHQSRKEAQNARHAVYEELDSTKAKLDTVRKDLGKMKESLTQKTKALDEARNQTKKKERREAKALNRKTQEERQMQQPQDSSLMQEEMKKLKGSLSAMEHQVATLQNELDLSKTQADQDAQLHWKDELSKLGEQLAEAEEKADKAAQSLNRYKKEVEEENNRKAQYPTPLDLESLDKDVVNELAKYFKKSEHYQRLYNVAQGQVKIAQDRASDLQRRYREVCRELAIVAGTPNNTNDAVQTAEAIVAAVATDEKHEARFGDANTNNEHAQNKRERQNESEDSVSSSV